MDILLLIVIGYIVYMYSNTKAKETTKKYIHFGKTAIRSNSVHIQNNIRTLSWSETREKVFEIYGRKCFLCGSTEEINVHHKIPRNQGGTNDITNLLPLCRNCHQDYHHFKFDDYKNYSFNDKYGVRVKKNTRKLKGYIILTAITKQKKLRIKYKKRVFASNASKTTERIIIPIALKTANEINDNDYIQNSEYDNRKHINFVEAYCFLRNSKRYFRFDNIEILEVLNN